MKTRLILLLAAFAFAAISPAHGQQKSGLQWETEADAYYAQGHSGSTPAERAEAFKKAAEHFEEAAKAYEAEGRADRAAAARTRAEQIRKHKMQTPTNSPRRGASSSGFHLGAGVIAPPAPSPLMQGPGLPDQLNDAVFADPALFEQLMERLGGEFFIGDPDAATFPGVEMGGENRLIPGLGLGVGFCFGLELGLRLGWFQTSWSGYFPYTVFPFSAGEPTVMQGVLSASASGLLGDAQARYYLPGRVLRPYIGGGVRGQWALSQSSSADMAGVALPFETTAMPAPIFSVFGDAGLRLNLGRNAYVQAGASYAKGPGSENYGVMGEAGLGWRFGGDCPGRRGVPSGPPVLVSVENDNCECGAVRFEVKEGVIEDRFKRQQKFENIKFDSGEKTSEVVKYKPDNKDEAIDLEVLPGDIIKFKIDGLETLCTGCSGMRDCKPDKVKVFTAKGKTKKTKDDQGKEILAPDYKEVAKPDKEQTFQLSANETFPVEIFIKVRYDCIADNKNKCKTAKCEKIFVMVFKKKAQ
jgi:hypothetical protein